MATHDAEGSPERLAATLPDEASARQAVSELAAAGVERSRIHTTDDGATVAPGRRRTGEGEAASARRGRSFVLWSAVLGGVVGAVFGGMVLLPLAEEYASVVLVGAVVGVVVGVLVGRALDARSRRQGAPPRPSGVKVVVDDVTSDERPTVEHLLRAASNGDDGHR